MNNFSIFVDISVQPQKKIGVGAFLILEHKSEILENLNDNDINKFKSSIIFQKYENTSSSTAETENLLFALNFLEANFVVDTSSKIEIFTDSQTILSLIRRKQKLQDNNFTKKQDHTEIKNADLYRSFYDYYEKYNFNLFKVQGHSKTHLKNNIEKIFTLVDRLSRKELRKIAKVESND